MTAEQGLDQIIERIQKLLALSTSSNPHEAALAAAKAQALLFRHNLSLATVQAGLAGSGASAYIVGRFDIGGETTWRRMLLAAVARNNFCRAVAYRGTPDVAIVGEPHNVRAVQALYGFLVGEIRRLADREWSERRRAGAAAGERRWKRAFHHGAVETIGARLGAQRAASARTDRATAALVVQKDRELDEAYRRHFPEVGPTRQAVVRSDDGYAAGARAAGAIPLEGAREEEGRAVPRLAGRR